MIYNFVNGNDREYIPFKSRIFNLLFILLLTEHRHSLENETNNRKYLYQILCRCVVGEIVVNYGYYGTLIFIFT